MTLAYSVPILPFTPLYTWVFEMCGEPFSYSRFSQQESGYKGWSLIEEFKRELSGVLRRKLVEVENLPSIIEE